MESGAIHERQISSFLYESDHPSSHLGRLNDDNPWCVGEENDKTLTVDLIDLHLVVGIVIQGYNKEHWVSDLTISRCLATGIEPVLVDVEEISVSAIVYIQLNDGVQPTNQPTYLPINQPTNQPTNQSTNQPINQSTNQPINQPTNQPTNQPNILRT